MVKMRPLHRKSINPIHESNFEVVSKNLPVQIRESVFEFGYDLNKQEIYLEIHACEENIKDIFLIDVIEDLSVKYYNTERKVLIEICFSGIEKSPAIISKSNYKNSGLLTKKLIFTFRDHIVLLD